MFLYTLLRGIYVIFYRCVVTDRTFVGMIRNFTPRVKFIKIRVIQNRPLNVRHVMRPRLVTQRQWNGAGRRVRTAEIVGRRLR